MTVEAVEAAFCALVGAAAATNEMADPEKGRTRCFYYGMQMEIMVPHFRIDEMEHFKQYRRLYDKKQQSEAAFTEQMRQNGVL